MCVNPKCTTLMGHQLHYKPNTVPDLKPGSIRTMSVSQLRGSGGEGCRPMHALKYYLAKDNIYTSESPQICVASINPQGRHARSEHPAPYTLHVTQKKFMGL